MEAYSNEGFDHSSCSESVCSSEDSSPKRIIIDRPVLTQCELTIHKNVPGHKENGSHGWLQWLRNREIKPKKTLLSLIPILSWLPEYEWRKNVSYDLVAGFVIAVMNIPQGMGYAKLGNLPPIVGIYMAFFPVIVYSILGTSRHVSMGTFAVICLMSGKATLDYKNGHQEQGYGNLEITTAMTFAVGIWQVAFGIFRLGAVSLLLNADLVSGFTTGAAVHVLTSQVMSILGLKIRKRSGIFKIILSYIDVGENIQFVNVTACSISFITIAVLGVYNELLKPVWSKRVPFPLPVELIAIIVGTLASKYGELNKSFNISTVGDIPTGFPIPELPNFQIVKETLFPDAFILAVVGYTVSISTAKIFAAKHNYVVGANQELLAQGGSNVVGSFFSCGPIASSLSRSSIQDQVGGRTQLTNLVSCLCLVFVLLWIGPFFETLPTCVLSAIIVVALKGMFMQFSDLKFAWRASKLNAFIWIASFLATVILDIEYGLIVGVSLSILTLVWRSNRGHVSVLGVHGDTELYSDVASSPTVKEFPSMKIIKYMGGLNFATAERFCSQILKIAPIGSEKVKKKKIPKRRLSVSTISGEKVSDVSYVHDREVNIPFEDRITWIILDMSSVTSLDPEAAKAFKALLKKYSDSTISVFLTGCTSPVMETMRTTTVLKQIGPENLFPTIHDAVVYSEVQCLNPHDS